jgi:spore coat polysaccharide biosynthesis predicted glycosyltransferase SpsG
LNYPQKDKQIYLLGTKYIPLRKEFWDVPEKEIKKELKSIMITFGGDDMRNMTPSVLKFFVEMYPDLEKKVVIGKGFQNINEILQVVDRNTEVFYFPDAQKMKEIMLTSDLAVSAGGQTLYELARVGTPTIAIAVADNQMRNVKGWEEVGFIKYVGWWQDSDLFKKLEIFVEEFKNLEERKKSSSVGRKFVDGKGSRRVVEFVLNLV